mmetsp:Transcript_27429/g.40221  ORF Transcript_27429/g.40221 Transcript_27429/m.40221 type:complete len:196 (+) Transcript_27429:161-748(+)
MKVLLHSSRLPFALMAALVCAIIVSSSTTSCVAFVANCPQLVFYSTISRHYPLSMAQDSNSDDNNSKDTSNENNNDKDKRITKRNDTVTISTSWLVSKARLEHHHTQQLLRRPPLKLPYTTSQKWIQHNFSIKTKEEFDQLVENGDIKNVYISKRPEEYYGRRGEWISWDHYLLGSVVEDEVGRRNGTESLLKWQ